MLFIFIFKKCECYYPPQELENVNERETKIKGRTSVAQELFTFRSASLNVTKEHLIDENEIPENKNIQEHKVDDEEQHQNEEEEVEEEPQKNEQANVEEEFKENIPLAPQENNEDQESNEEDD